MRPQKIPMTTAVASGSSTSRCMKNVIETSPRLAVVSSTRPICTNLPRVVGAWRRMARLAPPSHDSAVLIFPIILSSP